LKPPGRIHFTQEIGPIGSKTMGPREGGIPLLRVSIPSLRILEEREWTLSPQRENPS
jgi:hypothetical protein